MLGCRDNVCSRLVRPTLLLRWLKLSDQAFRLSFRSTTKFLYGGQCLAASDVLDGYYPNTASASASFFASTTR